MRQNPWEACRTSDSQVPLLGMPFVGREWKMGISVFSQQPGDADTASPPWSSEWQLAHRLWCRPGPLPHTMQTVQLQLLQVSPPPGWMLSASWGHSLPVGMPSGGRFFSFILSCSPGSHRKSVLPFLCGQPSRAMTAFPSQPGLSSPACTPLLLLMLSDVFTLP